jgi:hypothetical protein
MKYLLLSATYNSCTGSSLLSTAHNFAKVIQQLWSNIKGTKQIFGERDKKSLIKAIKGTKQAIEERDTKRYLMFTMLNYKTIKYHFRVIQ